MSRETFVFRSMEVKICLNFGFGGLGEADPGIFGICTELERRRAVVAVVEIQQLFLLYRKLCATYLRVFLFIKVKGGNGMEDNEILTLLWERKESALSELERKYGTRLKALASRMVSEEDAEECVNDTYLAVWNSVPPNRPEYLFAYAAKICRNLALNKIEREQAAKRSAVVVELSAELTECIPDNTLATDETGLRELIVRFLGGLSSEKRKLFLRRYWYGESVKELAEAFGYRESKVKSMLFRLRKQLWNELKKEDVI